MAQVKQQHSGKFAGLQSKVAQVRKIRKLLELASEVGLHVQDGAETLQSKSSAAKSDVVQIIGNICGNSSQSDASAFDDIAEVIKIARFN